MASSHGRLAAQYGSIASDHDKDEVRVLRRVLEGSLTKSRLIGHFVRRFDDLIATLKLCNDEG
jgi:hypothetical protein